jgi:hypothetical protein
LKNNFQDPVFIWKSLIEFEIKIRIRTKADPESGSAPGISRVSGEGPDLRCGQQGSFYPPFATSGGVFGNIRSKNSTLFSGIGHFCP